MKIKASSLSQASRYRPSSLFDNKSKFFSFSVMDYKEENLVEQIDRLYGAKSK